jgi:hypothetical protein
MLGTHVQESLTSVKTLLVGVHKSQWSTFLCGLAQSSVLSGPVQQRPPLTTDSVFSTPLMSRVQGKAPWVWIQSFWHHFPVEKKESSFPHLLFGPEIPIFSGLSWPPYLQTQCLWFYLSVLPVNWVWFWQLPMAFGNHVSKFKLQLKISWFLPENNFVYNALILWQISWMVVMEEYLTLFVFISLCLP